MVLLCGFPSQELQNAFFISFSSNLVGTLMLQPVPSHIPAFTPPTWVFLFSFGCPFLCLNRSAYRRLILFIHAHRRAHQVWAAAFWLPRSQGQSWIRPSSGFACCLVPVGVVERRVLLLGREALRSRHQAGGWEIRVGSKIWLLMEGEGCRWVVAQPCSCGDIRTGAPQAPPERGWSLGTAHAAADGGIHSPPAPSTLRCSGPVAAQASQS